MKTYIGEDFLLKAQMVIDSFDAGSAIGLAYNEDTSKLTLNNKNIYQVCDMGGLISNVFKFSKSITEYREEPMELCVLGIGYKGQIGLNEVATPFDSYTHVQKLTHSTKEEYSFLGPVPDEGITMGIKSICSAKRIIVVASGEKRAQAVFGMLYGRDDSTVPAAFLQLPANVEVFADPDAAFLI